MNTYRKNAVMTGILYFLGTAFGVSSGLIGGKVIASVISGVPPVGVDMLSLAAADSSRITWGALLTFMMAISLVGMTVFLYPVVRKASRELAMGLVLFRGALEGVFYMFTTLTFLTLLAVGNTYVAAGSDSAVLQTIGNLLYQFANLTAPISSFIFLIGATIIYVTFYRTRLIPRWISVWGFIAVAASLTAALLKFFHMDTGIGFYLDIAGMFPQELVMAIWLIVKGFNPRQSLHYLPKQRSDHPPAKCYLNEGLSPPESGEPFTLTKVSTTNKNQYYKEKNNDLQRKN